MSKRKTKDKDFFRKAFYPGGEDAMKAFIQKNLKYPEEALLNKIEGSVHVRFDINNKGKVFKAKAVKSIGHGCEKAAEDVVKRLKFEVPKNRGVRVIFHRDLFIHFHLPKTQPTPQATPGMNIQYHYTPKPKVTTEEDTKSQGGSYFYSV